MKLLSEFTNRLSTASELLSFFWRRKLWWMLPLVLVLLIVGLLLAFAAATGLGPFIYPLI
jgi:uncharacterized membrane protein